MAKHSERKFGTARKHPSGRCIKPAAQETSVESPRSQELLLGYQAGESDAADLIFRRYVGRMVALARSRMSARLRQRVDPDDIVQSAYRSFFVHARTEEYVLRRSGDLWRLLASITLHKLYGQAERHTAARRSVAREIQPEQRLALLASLEPTPVEAAALAEQLHLATDGGLILARG
jgi:RNA polymerase sigma-70 factor (ECF subfamily)